MKLIDEHVLQKLPNAQSAHHAIDLIKSLSCCMAKHISTNGTIPKLEKIHIRPKKFGQFSQRVRLNVENLSRMYSFFISFLNILCHQSFHPRSQGEIRKLRTIIKVGKISSRYIYFQNLIFVSSSLKTISQCHHLYNASNWRIPKQLVFPETMMYEHLR